MNYRLLNTLLCNHCESTQYSYDVESILCVHLWRISYLRGHWSSLRNNLDAYDWL